ncbi:hypothetical protein [Amycolatopsis thermoflava]|uniref:hypothetical protein n=1 Tax=Amycolatopsis thermoflava TaxID=84480 RepID=UPI0037FB91A0
MDWGNVPGWVAAVGTIGTLTLTVRVAWNQVRDRRQEQEDRRAAQARLVTAWVDDVRRGKGFTATVKVKNSSDQAVYGLRVSLAVGVRGQYVAGQSALGPGASAEIEFKLAGYPRGELEAPGIAFTDAGGLQWIRLATGELRHPSGSDLDEHFSEHPGSFERIEARNAVIKRLWEQDDHA